MYEDEIYSPPAQIDVLGLATLLLIGFMALRVIGDLIGASPQQVAAAAGAPAQEAEAPAEEASASRQPKERKEKDSQAGPQALRLPYDDYVLTQGPHGQSYGHAALDLAAGKGAKIKSPITGRVTQLYVDGIGNPTLVIENEAYIVTMLHGDYTVEAGDKVKIGQVVGYESNQGNTRDMQGNSCRGRDCGYHTHINIYDKQAGENVNLMNLLDE